MKYILVFISCVILIFNSCFADFADCEEPTSCRTHCKQEGKECTCSRGCHLELDQNLCIPHTNNPILAYITVENYNSKMYGRDLVTGSSLLFFTQNGKSTFRGMDYDAATETFFIIDVEKNSIFSYEPRTNTKDVLETYSSNETPLHIRWDWIAKAIYLIEFGKIKGCDQSLQYCSTLNTHRDIIYDFVLAPKSRYMFWNFIVNDAGIVHRSEMDGSNEITIILAQENLWHSLTVDHESERLYYASKDGNEIGSCDFSGEQRRTISLDNHFVLLTDLALFEKYYYYTNSTQKALGRCNSRDGLCTQFLKYDKNRNIRIQDMKIFHKSRQPTGRNHCLNSGCSQICLPNRAGFSCKCSGDSFYGRRCQTKSVVLPLNSNETEAAEEDEMINEI